MWDSLLKFVYAVTIAPVVFLWRALTWIGADLGRLLTVGALVTYFFLPFSSAVKEDTRTFAMLFRLAIMIPAIWGLVNLAEAFVVGVRGYYAQAGNPHSLRAGAWWPVRNEQWWAHLSWKLFAAYALAYAAFGYNVLTGVLTWPTSLTVNVGYLADLVRFAFTHSPTVYLLTVPLPPPNIVAAVSIAVAALMALEALRRLGAFQAVGQMVEARQVASKRQPKAAEKKTPRRKSHETTTEQSAEHATADSSQAAEGHQPEASDAASPKDSKARLTTKDVIAELKKELVLPDETLRAVAELAVLISDPEGFRQTWQMDPPKGALLWGPPGTGKTTIARKIAEITGMHFVNLSPANARSMWVGESAKLIQKAFAEARASAPAIVFIDEAETVAGSRTQTGSDGAGQEQIAAVNQLLQEIEGTRNSARRYVFVLAATNHPDLIDPAFRSRLGRDVPIGMPTHENRVEILQKLLMRIKGNLGHVDYNELASRTEGFSGRDLRTLVQLAVTRVHAEGRDTLEWGDLLDAVDEVFKNR